MAIHWPIIEVELGQLDKVKRLTEQRLFDRKLLDCISLSLLVIEPERVVMKVEFAWGTGK